MLRIPCPYCGERDHSEFSYGGPADLVYPDIDCEDLDVWSEAVFCRDNPRGPQREFWHHLQGCRLWMVVERDTLTHEIAGAQPVQAALKPIIESGS